MKNKKFFVVDGPLRAEHLPAPTRTQMSSTVLPIDYRYRPNPVRRLLHPATLVFLLGLAGGFLFYALIRSL